MQSKAHWEQVYTSQPATGVSWFQEHAQRSVQLIRRTGIVRDAPIIDVGGGASTLVDDLLAAGHSKLTVLDLSEAALNAARQRLGERAQRVDWRVGDITQVALPRHAYALWHDRAVFHFLTAPEPQAAYLAALRAGTVAGSTVVMTTFALDGPESCSGLPVQRYSPQTLAARLDPAFSLTRQAEEVQETPWGSRQKFSYAVFRREA